MAPVAMKSLDPGDLSPREAYQLMIGAIAPRPIALVSTVSAHGDRNLAPFSFFNGVSARPPIVSLAIARGRRGEKDTLRNVRATQQLVINVVDEAVVRACVASSGEYPPEVDEFDVSGLTPLASDKVDAPRVAESPVHLECVSVELVERPGGAEVTLVLARVLRFHVSRGVWSGSRIDAEALRPVGRLGGELYATLGDLMSIPRPEPQVRGATEDASLTS